MPGPGTVHSTGGAPTYTAVQSCNASNASATSINCVFPGNITSGNFIYIAGSIGAASRTLNFVTTSCTGLTLTLGPGVTATNIGNHAYGASTSTNACTIAFTTSGAATAMQVIGAEFSGSATNTVDDVSLDSNIFVTSGSSLASNVETPVVATVANDLIIAGYMDAGLNAKTFTTVSPSILYQQSTFGIAIFYKTFSGTGSVTMDATYNNSTSMLGGLIAVKP